MKALTAWEKGEAKPPFYREVLEEGVRRGDVVRKYAADAKLLDRIDELETQLREANAAAEFAQEQAEIAWAKLREAEGRIERATRTLLTTDEATIFSNSHVEDALSILAPGTEKEGDDGER